MLTFDDKGGGAQGGHKNPKPAYVIHGCSPNIIIAVRLLFQPVSKIIM